MGSLKFLFPVVIAILLAGSVSAVVFDAEWSTGGQSAAITNGQSIDLYVDGGSMNPPSVISVYLGSETIFTDTASSQTFSKNYTITPSMYSSPGTYTIEVVADDAAHYGFGPTDLTLTVNPAPSPPVNHSPVLNPIPNQQVNETSPYSYQVVASDQDNDVLTYSISVSPSASWLSINSSTGFISGTAPSVASDTVYTVRVNVSDGVNPAVTQGYSLTVKNVPAPDTTAPIITILGSNPVTVSQFSTYTDAGATAWDNVDGNLTSSIQVSGIVNTGVIGTYFINYTVSDRAGNIARAARTINVVPGPDTISPIVHLISPQDNIYTNNPIVAIFANATDDVALSNLTLYIWNATGLVSSSTVPKTGTSNSTSWSFVAPDGRFIWNVLGTDAAGNSNWSREGNYTFTVDTTAPSIQFYSPTPSNNQVLNQSYIPVNLTASDSLSGLERIDVFLYSSSSLVSTKSSISSPYSFSFSSLPDGTYYLNATAYDNAGNSQSTSTLRIVLNTTSSSGGGSGGSGSQNNQGPIYSYSNVYTPQAQEQSQTSKGISLGQTSPSISTNNSALWIFFMTFLGIMVLGTGFLVVMIASKKKFPAVGR